MDFVVYGVDFKHKPREFCVRRRFSAYLISCFHTDFLYEKDGELCPGHAGEYLLMPPNELIYHGPVHTAVDGFSNDWIYVGGDDFARLIEKYPLPVSVPFSAGRSRLACAIDKIHRERSLGAVGGADICDSAMTECIIGLYRDFVGAQGESDKLEYARGEVMRSLGRRWSLSDMAKVSGYSVSRFSAIYKQRYGVSPTRDLVLQRIEEAKLLLLYGSRSVGAVAEAVGFSSLYYFSRCFKEIVGVSPSEYVG